MQELKLGCGIDHRETVGLSHLRCDLGEMLGARNADGNGQAELHADPLANGGGDLGGRAEQMRAAGDVRKGLINGDAFDQRREIIEHGDRRVSEPLVITKVSVDEDQVGTELARPPPRHRAVNAECFGFVGGGEHHAAPDRNRLSTQRRVEHLLNRRIESVEIRMQDGGRGFHPAPRLAISRSCPD